MAVAAVIVIAGGCSKAEDPGASSQPPAGPPAVVGTGGAGATLDDDEFVRDVALKNLAGIELSRVALGRAADPDVRSFAQQMIDEHGAAGQTLHRAVSGQPIDWPAQLDETHRKTLDELATKQGAEFDRAYLKAMIEEHQNLAAKLESRLDVQSLTDWKTAAAARTGSKALPEPAVALRDVRVRPGRSGTPLAATVNQWAADTYPVAQKHLDAARTLEAATKKRATH